MAWAIRPGSQEEGPCLRCAGSRAFHWTDGQEEHHLDLEGFRFPESPLKLCSTWIPSGIVEEAAFSQQVPEGD